MKNKSRKQSEQDSKFDTAREGTSNKRDRTQNTSTREMDQDESDLREVGSGDRTSKGAPDNYERDSE